MSFKSPVAKYPMEGRNLILFLYFVDVFSMISACKIPPSEWCISEGNAKKCNVMEQCEKYFETIKPYKFNYNELKKSLGSSDVHIFEEDRVQLGLYYETMCPDCKDFMRDQLYPAYKAIPEIFTVDFIPYGNAMEYQDGRTWQFRCQHGKEECYGNIIQTCAINLYQYNLTFSFIACMELSSYSIAEAGKMCADRSGLDWQKLLSCSTSDKGNGWQHEMASKTKSLKPPHQFVPWITLNGEHTDAIQYNAEKNLIKLICDNFKGTKPKNCPKTSRRCLNDI